LPFVIIVLLAGLQTIPEEIVEAAKLDGAGNWAVLRYITIPFLTPSIVVAAGLSFIWTFNNFVYVWLATGGGPGTFTQVLGTAIYAQNFVSFNVGRGAAIATVGTVLVLLVMTVYFIIAQRSSDRTR
jgi:multiple sugar transport system permease protein